MKKRNIILLTITVLLISVLSFNIYHKQSITANKKVVADDNQTYKYGSIGANIGIDKRDENASPLAGAKFEVSTYNKIESFTSRAYNDAYYVDSNVDGREVFDHAKGVLSNEQRRAVDAIHTMQDFRNIEYGNEVYCYSDSETGEEDYYLPAGYYCSLSLPTIYYVEETKAPAGYAKEKVIVPGEIRLLYRVPDYPYSIPEEDSPQFRIADYIGNDNYNVELVHIYVYASPSAYTIDYGTINEEVLVGLNWDENYDYWDEFADIGRECASVLAYRTPSLRNHEIIKEQQGTTYPGADRCNFAYIVDKQGKATVEASNYVNNVESITTRINQTLEYKVVVKNTSNVDSIDNTIVASLPEGFIFVDGSASDNGVNSGVNITWTVPRLKAGEEVTFTYKAFAPRTVSPGQDYIGTASVESTSLDRKVESNKTMVRLAFNNPNTYGPFVIIVIVLMMSMWVVFLVGREYTQQRQQQTQE